MNGTPKMAARHVTGSLVIPFLGMLLMPAILQAQACIGSHASPREAAIAAVATFADDMAAVGGVSSWTRRVGTFGGVDFNGVSPETGGLFTVGVSIGNRRLYAGPSITISTIQGADAVLIVRTAIVL